MTDDASLEEVIVTGSRISRPDFESASPIVSIDQEAFERAASGTADTALNRLPQFVPYFTSTSNNPGNGGRANVQLRGLGSEATLVLIDGRRLVPADASGIVDVNVIPTSLIESVEVITGGASAVYGSDAIAGVVNFKLKRKFDGLQVDGRWGQTDRGDADGYSVGLTAGTDFAAGRGQVYGYVGYTKRDSLLFADRSWSEYALGYYGPEIGFLPEGSTSITQGRPAVTASEDAFTTLFESYGYPAGTVPYQRTFGVNQDGTLFTQGNGTAGSVANFRDQQDPNLYNDRRYTYNFAPWNYLQLPLERTSGYGRATYEFDGGTEIYGEALVANYTADQQLAPTPAFFLRVPRSNPYISPDLAFLLDSRANPDAPFRVSKRLDELGPRISSNQNDAYQLTAGFTTPMAGDWSLDAYAQYGSASGRERQSGNALRSRIEELTFAPDGGMAICGEFDLFGIDRISPECAQYISVSAVNRSGYQQTVLEATASGPLMSLPAGELRLAAGVMYKDDRTYYNGDKVGSVVLDDDIEDIQGFSASDDVNGSDSNIDFYVEALIPVVADRPWAERVELGLGYRHSQYQSAGGTDSWKVDLLYQPVQLLSLRGSFQHAVRAPSVFELYQPLLPTAYESDFAPDPCGAGSAERSGPDAAQVLQLCLAQGVPADLLPDFQDSDGVYFGVYGGNPDLKPESADTLTLGFVVSPQFESLALGRVQVSVDWYLMKVKDAIEYATADLYIPWCYDASTNPNFELSNRWCGFFARDAQTGDIDGLQDIQTNLDGYDVSGIDTQIDWSLPVGPGELAVNLLASWLDYFETVPPPGVKGDDQAGYVGGYLGGSLPEWKFNLNLAYAIGDWGAGFEWRYIDSMISRDLYSQFPDVIYRVPSQSYLGLYATYECPPGRLEGLTMRAGMENLTDEQPPIFPNYVAANTDPSQYDVLGRRYYMEMVYRF